METINKQVKDIYNNLVKQGYYIRPEIFKNTTQYAIIKQLGEGEYNVFGYVNYKTALKLKRLFEFKIGEKRLYFGKCEKIENDILYRNW